MFPGTNSDIFHCKRRKHPKIKSYKKYRHEVYYEYSYINIENYKISYNSKLNTTEIYILGKYVWERYLILFLNLFLKTFLLPLKD